MNSLRFANTTNFALQDMDVYPSSLYLADNSSRWAQRDAEKVLSGDGEGTATVQHAKFTRLDTNAPKAQQCHPSRTDGPPIAKSLVRCDFAISGGHRSGASWE